MLNCLQWNGSINLKFKPRDDEIPAYIDSNRKILLLLNRNIAALYNARKQQFRDWEFENEHAQWSCATIAPPRNVSASQNGLQVIKAAGNEFKCKSHEMMKFLIQLHKSSEGRMEKE